MRALLPLTLALASCIPGPLRVPDPEADAIVVLLSAEPDRHPDCNAFAIAPHELATAAHCVEHRTSEEIDSPRTARAGDMIYYVTRREWYTTALSAEPSIVTHYDRPHDFATLETSGASAPFVPLRVGSLCPHCANESAVRARSALFEWRSHSGHLEGRAIGGLGERWWESTIDVEPGWSGSPVFASSGVVIGVVSACRGSVVAHGRTLLRGCAPNYSLLIELP